MVNWERNKEQDRFRNLVCTSSMMRITLVVNLHFNLTLLEAGSVEFCFEVLRGADFVGTREGSESTELGDVGVTGIVLQVEVWVGLQNKETYRIRVDKEFYMSLRSCSSTHNTGNVYHTNV